MKPFRNTFELEDVPKYPEVERAIRELKADLNKSLSSNKTTVIEDYKALRDFIVTILICRYGRRIGEVAQVKFKYVNLEDGVIVFKIEKTGDDKSKKLQKIIPEIKPYLEKYMDMSYSMFNKELEDPLIDLTIRQIRNVMYEFSWKYLYRKRYKCKRCNSVYEKNVAELNNFICGNCSAGDNIIFLDKLTLRPHAFRHSVGRLLQQLTKDPEVVRNWMGHKDIKTTMIYFEYDITSISDRIPFFDKEKKDETKTK